MRITHNYLFIRSKNLAPLWKSIKSWLQELLLKLIPVNLKQCNRIVSIDTSRWNDLACKPAELKIKSRICIVIPNFSTWIHAVELPLTHNPDPEVLLIIQDLVPCVWLLREWLVAFWRQDAHPILWQFLFFCLKQRGIFFNKWKRTYIGLQINLKT